MLVELFLAALALYVWMLTEPGIVRAMAFNVMVVAGVSTLVVTRAEGVVWLPDQSILRAGGGGFFQRWLIAPGAKVQKGAPLFVLEDALLATELDVARAKVSEAEAKHRAEQFSNPVKAGVSLRQLEQEQEILARIEERAAKLVGYAEADGVLTMSQHQDMPGRYYKKGELIGYVLERNALIARIVVPQDDIDLVRNRFQSVELRLADWIVRSYPAVLVRQASGGVEELPTPALGLPGGGAIPTLPSDPNGVKTIGRIFMLDLGLPAEVLPAAFGERVHVRFDHGYEPIAWQGLRRLRQLFLGRFGV